MNLPKFTSFMLSNQPDQTAYLLNKLVQEGVGGTGGGGGDIHLYPSTGQHTDGAMTQKATTDALGLKADSSTVSAQLANKVDKEVGKGLSSNDFTDADQTKLANIPTNIMTTDTAQTVTGTKTFHNAEIATDNMITLKNNATSLIRGMSGIEYRQLLKRGSTDVEVGNTHDPLALKGSGTRPKYNSTNLLVDSDLDNVVFHDDPSTVVPTVPYVNTGDIVSEAVTADKIDWNTIGHWDIYLAGNQSVTQAAAYSYVDVPGASVSFTAVVGATYLVIFTGALCCVNSSADCYAAIMLNGNWFFSAFGQTYSADRYAGVCAAKAFTATQTNNTVSIKIGGGVPNSDYRIYGNSSVQIIRVA